VKNNFDPKTDGPKVLQKLLYKQFNQLFSDSQLSYLLHRLFHKGSYDVQHLVEQILQKNTGLDYKIGFDEVNIIMFFALMIV